LRISGNLEAPLVEKRGEGQKESVSEAVFLEQKGSEEMLTICETIVGLG